MDSCIVISLTADLPRYASCKVVPADEVYPATYTKAFGPDSKAACEKWIAANCEYAEI